MDVWKGRIIRALVAELTDEELGEWWFRVSWSLEIKGWRLEVQAGAGERSGGFEVGFQKRDLELAHDWKQKVLLPVRKMVLELRQILCQLERIGAGLLPG